MYTQWFDEAFVYCTGELTSSFDCMVRYDFHFGLACLICLMNINVYLLACCLACMTSSVDLHV